MPVSVSLSLAAIFLGRTFSVVCSTEGSITFTDQLDALSSGLSCRLLMVSGQAARPSWPGGEPLGPAERGGRPGWERGLALGWLLLTGRILRCRAQGWRWGTGGVSPVYQLEEVCVRPIIII